MISENRKQELRNLLPDYLERYHNISRRISEGKKKFTCLNPAHDDHNPSMELNRKTMQCHCFSCQASYDIFDLVGIDYKLGTFPEQYSKACEIYSIQEEQEPEPAPTFYPLPEPEQEPEPIDYSYDIRQAAMQIDEPEALEYLKQRGISPETAVKHLIGYDPRFIAFTFETWRALIIPTGDRAHSFTARNIDAGNDPKARRYDRKGKAALFNAKAITEQTESPLFIVEGEIDAISISEVGGCAVGLGSASNTALIEAVAAQIHADRLIVLALDNDKAGADATDKLVKILTEKKKRFEVYNPYGTNKDANAALTADREAFAKTINNIEQIINERRLQEYRANNSVSALIAGFLESVADSSNSPISTGFKNIDKILDGGLYKNLYTVGAISGLGKTTLMLQIADQIAAGGHDVLFYSLEMGTDELIAKSLSRNTLVIGLELNKRREYAMTMRQIADGSRWKDYTPKQLERIMAAIDRYKTYSDRLYYHAAVGLITVEDIRKDVEIHKLITGHYPIVFVDYLQILKAENEHSTDKQAVDTNITLLKQLARNTPVIAISSLNRQSYALKNGKTNNGGQITISDFKESGNIDFGFDIVIGLQFSSAGSYAKDFDGKTKSLYDEREEKKKDPREITAVILKNRYFGAYEEAQLRFIPQFNYFCER